MHDTIPLTAVILTKNEESQVARAIASLRFCRRVVVLDSGSTDGTRRVAEAAGAEFVVNVPDPPFRISEQRNWALDHLGIDTPWVLYLDADEVVPEALARRLARLAAEPDSGLDAYELTPRYLFWGTWLRRTQGYPNWHPRLVRHGRARFAGGVWEHFVDGIRVGRIEEPYDHYANAKGLRDWLDRHYRYASWDADRIIEMLDTGSVAALGTTRKKGLRRLAARFWPLRPLARFLHMYVLRLGFLEGWKSLNFCLLYFCYELMTVNLIVEKRRQRDGRDL
ncbi:MAG: glycosyltransferase family 2 protein [Planctomycetota bacterium]